MEKGFWIFMLVMDLLIPLVMVVQLAVLLLSAAVVENALKRTFGR